MIKITYAGVYTTATKVASRFEDIDIDISVDEIGEFIHCAESIVNVHMQHSFIKSFDSTKHGLIEDTASLLVVVMCLSTQPTGQTGEISTSRSALMADLWWAQIKRNLRLLSDTRVIEYLKGL